MSDLETQNVISPPLGDEEYIREVAQTKRALELWTMEPGFQEAFLAAPEETLAKNGLSVDALSVKILCLKDMAQEYRDRPPEEIPRAVRRYRAFIREKIAQREHMAAEACVPDHPAFRAWRRRQQNRCWIELGQKNSSIVHVPLNFELDLGCSVGCPFCGVMAPRLQKICRYDEENAALWRGILSWTKETMGSAAGSGTCYYATEPLDNPDYEKFADDFFAIFGVVPQLTTAAAMRKPERTRGYLAHALGQRRCVHRFSVLSLDILHQIFAAFTPEELVCVELLPQFAEAPQNRFAKTGRARENRLEHVEADDGNTIACVSGFVVNMAERSIRLVTPRGSSEAHPTGELIIAKEPFAGLDDFRRVFTSLLERYMRPEFSHDQPLILRPGISFGQTAAGIEFSRGEKFRLKFLGTEGLPAALYHDVLDELQSGGACGSDIAAKLMEETGAFPANVFFVLKKFEQAGLFLEPYEAETEKLP